MPLYINKLNALIKMFDPGLKTEVRTHNFDILAYPQRLIYVKSADKSLLNFLAKGNLPFIAILTAGGLWFVDLTKGYEKSEYKSEQLGNKIREEKIERQGRSYYLCYNYPVFGYHNIKLNMTFGFYITEKALRDIYYKFKLNFLFQVEDIKIYPSGEVEMYLNLYNKDFVLKGMYLCHCRYFDKLDGIDIPFILRFLDVCKKLAKALNQPITVEREIGVYDSDKPLGQTKLLNSFERAIAKLGKKYNFEYEPEPGKMDGFERLKRIEKFLRDLQIR